MALIRIKKVRPTTRLRIPRGGGRRVRRGRGKRISVPRSRPRGMLKAFGQFKGLSRRGARR